MQQLSTIASLRADLVSQEDFWLGKEQGWERERTSIIITARGEVDRVARDSSEMRATIQELQAALKAAEEGWRSVEGEARCEKEKRGRVETELREVQRRSEELERELRWEKGKMGGEVQAERPMSESGEGGSDGSRLRKVSYCWYRIPLF